jgi:hypothetical protein
MSMTAPLRGAKAVDPGAPTIIIKKHRQRPPPPEEVSEMEIRKRPPSMLKNVDGGPLGLAPVGVSVPIRDLKVVLLPA